MLRHWQAILIIIAASLSSEVYAQKKDTLFFYKGQILVGDIRGAQLGLLTIDETDLGLLQIKMYKIKAIKATRRFKIVTHTLEDYYGILQKSAKDGWVNIQLDNGEIVPYDILGINLIIALEKKFLTQLNGNLSAGFSYSKSSSIGQSNLSLNVQFATERLEYLLSISAIGSLDSSKYSRDRENAGLFISYSLSPDWFLGTGFGYRRNLELSIASRYQELIGAGNKIFTRRYWQLLALSGLTFNQEKSTSGKTSALLLEVPLIFRFDFFKYSKPNIQVNSSQSFFYSLSQKDRVRYDGNLTFSWELVRRFYLTLNPYANFDNQPPEGNSNFDYGLAISITYRF
jgi:hypothetical protein